MFNYERLKRAEEKYQELIVDVEQILSEYDIPTCGFSTQARVRTAVKILNQKRADKIEREKIETIMRDLLKANVFKQV